MQQGMKSRFLPRVALLLLAALFTIPVTSAAPKIGVLLKAKTPFWAAAEKGALEAGEKLGAEVLVRAPLTENDISVQVQLLNALVAQNIEALVIAPMSKEFLAAPVAAAAAKGIKVVIIDSALDSPASPVFIGTDQRAAGEAAGELLARLISTGDEVSFLKHNQNSGATSLREAGALDKLRAAYPNLVTHGDIYSSTEKNVESVRAALVLSKYPKTKGIIASSTGGTLAMLKLMETKNTDGAIKFIGFGFNLNADVAAGIDSGVMHGWVAQLPGKTAYQGVEAALNLLAGKEVPATVNTPFIVITKDNLKTPEVQALLAQ
jgi:ribose transport system substrate-binding protein